MKYSVMMGIGFALAFFLFVGCVIGSTVGVLW